MKKTGRNFLKEFLKFFPYGPGFSLYRGIEARILSGVDLIPPVLDFGCGDGSFAKVFFKNEKVAAGVDIDDYSLGLAKKLDIYMDLRKADAASLPWDGESFGTVFSNCVLEHIENIEGALKEAFRVLKNGGKFVATVPSENLTSYLYRYKLLMEQNNHEKAGEYIEQFNFRHRHYRYLNPGEWKELLEKIGFSEIEIKYYLAPETTTLWSKLEYLFTCELSGILNSGAGKLTALALIITPGFLSNFFWGKYLEKAYLADVEPPGKGGGLLITAGKLRQ
ncbi:MAG: class I SAM-dependent methyltransferase [Chloroflexi bacterium]|nr:class I SAM-dependent methyltransferase [Chloroflexota bacterium]